MAANDSFRSDGNRLAGAALGFYLSLQSFTNLYCIGMFPVIYFRDATPANSRDECCPVRGRPTTWGTGGQTPGASMAEGRLLGLYRHRHRGSFTDGSLPWCIRRRPAQRLWLRWIRRLLPMLL